MLRILMNMMMMMMMIVIVMMAMMMMTMRLGKLFIAKRRLRGASRSPRYVENSPSKHHCRYVENSNAGKNLTPPSKHHCVAPANTFKHCRHHHHQPESQIC